MKVFFDTSSLFKLYHRESGTDELIMLFKKGLINEILISEITKIEFSSVVWKKCRKREIEDLDGETLIRKFNQDAVMFQFIDIDNTVVNVSKELIQKYWKFGLRTLDSIQLASAIQFENSIDLFLSSDNLLLQIAEQEGFKTDL